MKKIKQTLAWLWENFELALIGLIIILAIVLLFSGKAQAQPAGVVKVKCHYYGKGNPGTSVAPFSGLQVACDYFNENDSTIWLCTSVVGGTCTWIKSKTTYGVAAKGDKGDTGQPGTQGIAGQAATVTVGTTNTLPAGSTATVTNSGTTSNAVLNFGIPKGADGSGGGGGGNITVYNSVLSMLKSTQTTGIAVTLYFHANGSGNGETWFVDGNISKADYVNHFKNATGNACWHRLKPSTGTQDVDFGAPGGTANLASLGYTQQDANLLFDPSYGITTAYNIDDAAHITTGKGIAKGYVFINQTPVQINTRFDVALPKTAPYTKPIVTLAGNGMLVKLLTQNQIGYKRKTANFAEAENNDSISSMTIHLDGYLFRGIKGYNQQGTDIDASFGATITRNHTDDVDLPFTQRHCMLTTFRNNIMWSPVKGYQNLSMAGTHAGADENNSGGNMSTIMDSRVYAAANTQVGFETNRSSSPYYINNIFEGEQGSNPGIGALIDFGTSTTCKNGEIYGWHGEIKCSDAMIKLKLPASGNFNINQLWMQAQGTIIDVVPNGGGYPNITIENMPWIPAGANFNASTAYWYFINSTENDLFNSSYWKNGTLPNFLTQIKHTGGLIQKSNYPFKFEGSMTLNNKSVLTAP